MKLIAAIPCRAQSSRLYAKPLQHIDVENKVTILEYLVRQIRMQKEVSDIVLAVGEGPENTPFLDLAQKMEISAVVGDTEEVMSRMICAAKSVGGDTILRITSECPFIYFDTFTEVFELHCKEKSDLTVIENLPDGAYYELIQTKALVRSYEMGHRGAWVTLHIKEHPEIFKTLKLQPLKELCRPELRITVDYPEDLMGVRAIYSALKGEKQFPALRDIIGFLDAHPVVRGWVTAHEAGAGRIWD
ncbi:MAG: acylneuraminate cytidylyltransferase [Deltaproteobacteria bacterium]|nr:acylneuraminate cytidylyltransferase [Deltaproteobacteria bacterium]